MTIRTATLPPDVAPYRRTPIFSVETVPQGLLRDHKTAAGVWGVIHVVTGVVTYRVAEDDAVYELTPAFDGVISPGQIHSVALSPDASFYVEFHRAPPD